MSFEIWFAFALASAALLAIPGPTIMLVVSYALGNGSKSGLATVPGVALGDFTAMTVSLLGAGAVLAASATLFTTLKFAGAAYLIWLGIGLWRAKPDLGGPVRASDKAGRKRMFWNAYIVTTLNPKGIIFFIAFLPLFVEPSHPTLPQFAILEVTFIILGTANAVLWALFGGQLHVHFRKPSTLRLINRIGGSFLIGAGALAAAARRAG